MPERMTRPLIIVALSLLPLLFGCASSRNTALESAGIPVELSPLATMSTADLESRRAEVAAQIAAIQREVELKAGLHMGVFISDDRSHLFELHRESESIERELLRRGAYPDRETLRAKL
jgi:hypothetical protein